MQHSKTQQAQQSAQIQKLRSFWARAPQRYANYEVLNQGWTRLRGLNCWGLGFEGKSKGRVKKKLRSLSRIVRLEIQVQTCPFRNLFSTMSISKFDFRDVRFETRFQHCPFRNSSSAMSISKTARSKHKLGIKTLRSKDVVNLSTVNSKVDL